MPLWKRDVKSKLKELIREEEYREIDSLVDKDINVLVQLVGLLENKDPQVRGKAATALAGAVLMHEDFYFQQLENIVIPRVLKLLGDRDAQVRREAALTVSSFPCRAYCGVSKQGPELIEQATPNLIQLLEDRDPQVQRSAGTSLFAVAFFLLDNGKDARSALGILSKLAEHTDVRNREDSAWFWKKHANRFPETAKEAIPLLLKLIKDPDEEVRHSAESSLKLVKEVFMSPNKNKKSRWDYLGKEPEVEEDSGVEEEVRKTSIRPEDYSKDQLYQLYEKLPEDLKDAIFSTDVADINGDLAEKYGFSNKVSKFAELEGYVLLGILPIEEFKEKIEKDVELNPKVSEALLREVDRLIFEPVRESLNKLYKEG